MIPFQDIASCDLCPLKGQNYALSRTHRGEGKKVMFVGEAPGAEEAKQHLAFVGRSGKLLDKWIAYLDIDNYVITNIVRHRPPENRVPAMDEINACIPYLYEEIKNENPHYIIALGKTSAIILTCYTLGSYALVNYVYGKSVMGKEFFRKVPGSNSFFSVSVLYHPSYVLRSGIDMTQYLNKLKKMISEAN